MHEAAPIVPEARDGSGHYRSSCLAQRHSGNLRRDSQVQLQYNGCGLRPLHDCCRLDRVQMAPCHTEDLRRGVFSRRR
jgi:hypothetical protein